MKIAGGAVRMGIVIEWQDKLWQVVKHEIRTPGNLSSFNQVEMRDVKTGTKTNTRLGQSDKIERVSLEQKKYQFLYMEGEDVVIMDLQSYEQMHVKKEMVGAAFPFLQDNMEVNVESYDGNPLSITLPERVTLQITETEPVIKNQTASSSYKPAKLENGVRVMVPPFISSGDKIVVNTTDLTYVERAK